MKYFLTLCIFSLFMTAHAQNETELVSKVKAKLAKVTDYKASGKMKIDVSFINAPESDVTIYFKKPDHFKVEKKDGISILPKGGISVNLSALLSNGDYTVVPAGSAVDRGVSCKIVKLLPLNEGSDVILSTLYIEEKNMVIRKTSVTTRENGTYEMELTYGKFISWGLPDKVVFSFNAKDYKLPKGITFEYEKGGKKPAAPKNAKGKIEISYSSYQINKGVSDNVFKDPK
jgi:hypothetical protein